MAPKYSLAAVLLLCSGSLLAQQGAPQPVQPGAPGQPTRTVDVIAAPPAARAPSEADVRFMQDMIMHHGQAVEMTDLAKTRAASPDVVELAHKIDVSQTDEIKFMKRWLNERGVAVEEMSSMPGMDHAAMGGMAGMDHSNMAGMDHSKMNMPAAGATDPQDVAMMPGMLTPRQMVALRNAKGTAFDELFLTGMMQHHGGALLMVKQLLAQPGAGQDPVLFDFANDVDNTQLAEIDIMKGILRKVKP